MKAEIVVLQEKGAMFSLISIPEKSDEVGPDSQFAANGYYAGLMIID
jgi:hypothetical protein